jgi:hypothetical protein
LLWLPGGDFFIFITGSQYKNKTQKLRYSNTQREREREKKRRREKEEEKR